MKRDVHNLSHRRILTCQPGYLIPAGFMEVNPGDTFQHNTTALLRAIPMAAPLYHKIRVRIRHYFVPNRLVWPDFTDKFITRGDDGEQTPTVPTIAMTTAGRGQAAVGSLADYYGIPTSADATVAAYWARGYGRIYNDLLRNTQLQTERVVSTAGGVDTTTDISLQATNWDKDPFTSCTPEPQLGPEVTMPLGDEAPVHLHSGTFTPPDYQRIRGITGALVTNQDNPGTDASGTFVETVGDNALYLDPGDTMYADLAAATGISILQLRNHSALQRFFEGNNRRGSNYYEWLRSLGVRYSDSRMQIPEYLGGSQSVIQHSEVLSTSDIGGENLPGQMYGHGLGSLRTNRYRWTAQEHGFIHTIMEILPEAMYPQGIPKSLLRFSNVDHWLPEFAHVGSEEVYYKELYAAHSTPDGVFGYRNKDDSYRFLPSTVHGDFRTTLNYWHAARIFAGDPALNASFVSAADVTHRIFQVTDPSVRPYLVFLNHDVRARRLVSRNSRPGVVF